MGIEWSHAVAESSEHRVRNVDVVAMQKEDVLEKSFHQGFKDEYCKDFKHY